MVRILNYRILTKFRDMNLQTVFKDGSKGLITVEATVDTGFENVALDECKEVFGSELLAVTSRGRIFFTIHQEKYEKVHELRSIDNLYLVSALIPNLNFSSDDKDIDLELIKILAETLEWKTALGIWKECTTFNGNLYPTIEEHDESSKMKIKLLEKLNSQGMTDRIAVTSVLNSSSSVLRFRVTCNRSGKHSFGSMDAARDFGGKLHDVFHWVVDLTSYNIDIVLNIIDNMAYVALGLTRQSKHRRNITHFGPTTLRATVCYNLLRLSSPQVGDIVIDPLCGGGSIPIEGALAYPSTYQICGDSHDKAVNRSRCNIESQKDKSLSVDVLQWNATSLPLLTASVDVFVTDLPFGKRSGHKKDNRVLYKEVLMELGRVVRPHSGRAVLLTHDKRTFVRVLPQTCGLWKQTKVLGVNLGGLQAGVFLLLRTAKVYVK
uniref:THUMP domain-containing protein n=1 Tax=Graphocephala atropunctata TaxID=36148 RepID=A0A1B6LJN9_9HEMI